MAVPAARATRSPEEAWNRTRRTRGICRRAHDGRRSTESAGNWSQRRRWCSDQLAGRQRNSLQGRGASGCRVQGAARVGAESSPDNN
jgi:hypothetical protein